MVSTSITSAEFHTVAIQTIFCRVRLWIIDTNTLAKRQRIANVGMNIRLITFDQASSAGTHAESVSIQLN
jgi:hypothetical protein